EVLYASEAKLPFTYVVGANFFDARQTQNVSVPIAGLATGADLNNDGIIDTLFDGSLLPTGDLIPVTVNLGGTVKTRSYAAFAHAQYEVLPDAKIFACVRYSHDRKEAIEYNNFFGDGTQRAAWSRFTYEVGASYDFSNQITGYVKYATGYKS